MEKIRPDIFRFHIVGADEHGNSCHPLFRNPFLPQDKHQAENQTNRGSRFGQKPIP